MIITDPKEKKRVIWNLVGYYLEVQGLIPLDCLVGHFSGGPNKSKGVVLVSEKIPSVTDVIGSGSLADFYPDLTQKSVEELMGQELIITDARLVRDWDGEWGKSNFVLLALKNEETGEEFTTLAGGVVLFKRVQELKDKGLLPVRGVIYLEQGKSYEYFNVR